MQNHHPLISEFPEYKEAIHTLKMENNHFKRLSFEYEGIDKEIVRLEQGIEHASDTYIEELKKERLALKDTIYLMLKNA
jgi:uncharacterized protein YdcH (DUF465 family)